MPTWDKSNGTICQTEVDIQSFEANAEHLLGKQCIFFRFFGRLKVPSPGYKGFTRSSEQKIKKKQTKKRKPERK